MIQKLAWMRSIPKWFWIFFAGIFVLGVLIGHSGSNNRNTETGTQAATQKVAWWTCSMHPQIKLPNPGQCPICFMDLIPLVTGDSDSGPRELKMSEASVRLAEIVTEPVHHGAAKIEVGLQGKIVPDERRVKTITAWVPGRIEKLFVDFTGTTVKKGDALVELYSPALYAAQEELLQAIGKNSGASSEYAGGVAQASREKLVQLGLQEDQIREIEKQGVARDRMILLSPISGVVIHKNALEGEYVDKGMEIFDIADLSAVWAILDAYEKEIGVLKQGQAVTFDADALPGTVFKSRIAFIDPVLDNETRSVRVRLDVDNPRGLLKPGMFVSATVSINVTDGKTEPLLIPASAPLITGNRAVVYVKKTDAASPTFEGREVTLGPKVGDQYVVVSGLTEGEEVVVKGNFKIDSEMQIQAKPSLMNPEGGVITAGHEHQAMDSPQSSKVDKPAEDTSRDTSLEFRESLKPVFHAYLKTHQALAGDDFTSAQKSLTLLHAALQSPAPGLPSPDSWKDIQQKILSLTEHAPHWSDIESTRKAFDGVSEQMLRIVQTFGNAGTETLYRAHCPMAFDNGADWLQADSTIANPYFGSKMPRCGEIKERFEAKNH